MCSARSWRCCCKSASTIWQTPPAPPSNGRRYCAISTACSSCACATAAPTGWFAPTPHPPLPRCSATPRSPYRRVSSRSRRRPRHRRQNPPQNPAAARDVVPRPPEFRQNPRDISCLAKQGVQVGYDEVMATAIKRQYEPARIIGELLAAEIAEKQARSIKYQMTLAKLPLAKDLAGVTFAQTPINETLVRDLATGAFLAEQRNAVLGGGTGTGKSHLAIAIARAS